MSRTTEIGHATELRQFKPYLAYKDSDVDWLGEMPTLWKMKRLKNCVDRLESGGTPESANPDYWSEDQSGIPWVAISDMTRAFLVRETAKRVTERGLTSKGLTVLPAGTLLYSMYASLGKVALLEIDAAVNQAILGLVTRKGLASRDFLRWWLEFMQGHIKMLSSSNTQDNLNAEKIRTMPVFLPSPKEQAAIATFLDRETTRIDNLVAKKERLIELLQEQRSALITRAVTKGLDSRVPMRDSGIEWLAGIPAHWDVNRLSQVIDDLMDFRGRTPPKLGMNWGGDIPAVSAVNVRDGFVDLSRGVNYGSRLLHDRWMTKGSTMRGDVLFTTEAPLGNTGLVPDDELYILSQRVVLLRPAPTALLAQFLQRYLSSAAFRHGVEAQATGSTAEGVKRRHLMAMPVVKPTLAEQQAIVNFLNQVTTRIDTLVAKIRDAIDRLKEYRAALISAAVTGQIDVREEAA